MTDKLVGEGWVAYFRGNKWDLRYYDQVKRLRHRVPDRVRAERDAKKYIEAFLRERLAKDKATGHPALTKERQIHPKVTIRQFGELWTSGTLHDLFPLRISKKASANDDAIRLHKHVYPEIGDIQVRAFVGQQALVWAEQVLQKLPANRQGTARQVGQAVSRLLTMAAFPGIQLIPQNPLPKGYVPPVAKKKKAKSYLYPSEEVLLMANPKVPLKLRVFFGLCVREGARIGNFLNLRFNDLDLKRGIIRLDNTKTDEPISWVLDPGTAVGLRRYRERCMKGTESSAFVFLDSDGKFRVDGEVVHPTKFAALLRQHLTDSGIRRPELFEHTEHRQQFRAHDLRSSFITVKLALGKSESWVMDRTGHKSSQMINTYRRRARSHVEANLGDFVPLQLAIPELASDD